MAKTKTKTKPESKQKQIESEESDPFQRAARVQEETSNDGKFSTYERVPGRFPEDGDLILQHRGEPK